MYLLPLFDSRQRGRRVFVLGYHGRHHRKLSTSTGQSSREGVCWGAREQSRRGHIVVQLYYLEVMGSGPVYTVLRLEVAGQYVRCGRSFQGTVREVRRAMRVIRVTDSMDALTLGHDHVAIGREVDSLWRPKGCLTFSKCMTVLEGQIHVAENGGNLQAFGCNLVVFVVFCVAEKAIKDQIPTS